MEYKKISVLIVTYKQADVIGRNIESILQQKEYGLHEIVICDDCSPDNNWEVIQSYVEKYPNIIRAYRNDPNLGIYGNSDKCASLHGDADLFCWLEGDDALELGVFKAVQEKITNENINTDEAIGIFCDYSSISPDGMKSKKPNNKILTGRSPLSLYLRNLISWRASFFSKRIIDRFTPTILNQGLALAELLFDSQWFRYMDKAYYCPVDGSVYFTGIGVSVNLGYGSSFKGEEALVKWSYFLKNGLYDSEKDEQWLKFKINQAKFVIKPNVLLLFKCFYFFTIGRYRGISFKNNFYPLFKLIIYGK